MNDIKRTITPNDPADFTPNRQPQIPLQPFRYWCQKVLPLVYDDSLSYYELLCKVVDYLNKTMEDVTNMDTDMTNLYTAYSELQSYVNSYFDSLDVQQEINNKLDEMASSGALQQIFLSFIGTGAYPTFVSSTSEMTDINKIYVLASNGHIYYYNGTSFVDTGIIYGATGMFRPANINIQPSNIPFNDANDAVNGLTYFINQTITEDMLTNLPEYGNFSMLSTFNFSDSIGHGKYQIFVSYSDELPNIYFRMEWGVDASSYWSKWAKWLHDVDAFFPSNINIQPNAIPFNNANDAVNGLTYFVNQTITEDMLTNLPEYGNFSMLSTFNYSDSISHGKYQIFVSYRDELPNIYFRMEWGVDASSYWSKWTKCSNDFNTINKINSGLSVFDTIVSVGDSLSCGYQRVNNTIIQNNYEYSVFQYFVKKYNTKVFWGGASGITTVEFLNNSDGYSSAPYTKKGLDYVKQIGAKALYIVALGANDAENSAQNVPIGSPDTIDDETTFYGAYNKIINEIHTLAPSAYIVCVSDFRRTLNDNYRVNAPKYVAELYPDFCAFIDITNSLATITNKERDAHYTAEGYYMIGSILDYAIGEVIKNNNWNDAITANVNSSATDIDPYEKA